MKNLLIAAVALVAIPTVALASSSYYDLLRPTVATNTAVTITAGGTYQQALAQNVSRKNCTILNNNTSDALYIFFGTTTAANTAFSATSGNQSAIVITHGNSFNCATASVGVVTDAIQINGDNTSDTAVVIENQ